MNIFSCTKLIFTTAKNPSRTVDLLKSPLHNVMYVSCEQ